MHHRVNFIHVSTAGLLTAILFGIGCAFMGGGGGSDLKKSQEYRAAAPANWKPVEAAESDRAFSLPGETTVTLTSSCNKTGKASLELLTKHLLIGSRNVTVLQQEKRTVGKNEGLLTSVKATLEGKPFNLLLFVLPAAGCVFDFSLVSPKEISESNRQDFINYVQSFKHDKD